MDTLSGDSVHVPGASWRLDTITCCRITEYVNYSRPRGPRTRTPVSTRSGLSLSLKQPPGKDLLARTARFAAEHTRPPDTTKAVRSRQLASRGATVDYLWTVPRVGAARGLDGVGPLDDCPRRRSRGHSEDSRAGETSATRPDSVATGMTAVRVCSADRSSVGRCRLSS